MTSRKAILEKLKEVMDPELGINIVDLGLIYNINIQREKKKGSRQKVRLEVMFTTPMCPMMNFMLDEIQRKLNEIKDADFEVSVVFEPRWTPDRMSAEAKKKLGIK
ncbi:MAG: metal-sulfur cluster assembly factor [Candidatus Bilamarchaeaceae archaeon]